MPKDNKHFERIDRAAYEIARLLEKMPELTHFKKPTAEHAEMAEALIFHSCNAAQAILNGLEGLGYYWM